MSENWNPNTMGPDCDWCGECDWCRPAPKFEVGDRVKVPPSNWRPSALGTVVDASEFCATGPVYVKRDDTGMTVGYRQDVVRHAPDSLPIQSFRPQGGARRHVVHAATTLTDTTPERRG